MHNSELVPLVDRLRHESVETAWLGFKRNRYKPQAIGEHFSSLANSACLAGKAQVIWCLALTMPRTLSWAPNLIRMPPKGEATRICSSG